MERVGDKTLLFQPSFTRDSRAKSTLWSFHDNYVLILRQNTGPLTLSEILKMHGKYVSAQFKWPTGNSSSKFPLWRISNSFDQFIDILDQFSCTLSLSSDQLINCERFLFIIINNKVYLSILFVCYLIEFNNIKFY